MKKILLFIGTVIVVVLLAYHFGLVDLLTNVHRLRLVLASVGWWGYGIFIALNIAVSIFLLPGSLLAIVGGLCYGGLLGGTLTVIGATLGSATAFMIAKYVARDYIVKKFGQNQTFKKIDKGVRENGLTFLIFTRLVPVFPYAIQSYAYALTPMKLRNFTLISFLTMIPASFIYAYLASEILTHGLSARIVWDLTLAGVLLAALSILPKHVSKKLHRLVAQYRSNDQS